MHGSRLMLGAVEVVRKVVPAVLVSVTNKYTRPAVAIQLSAPPIDAGFPS